MAVFHLKYRPQKVSELDLTDVADKIAKIIENKEGFQSLLFAGPKGSGKTSAARIIARAVNCLKPQKGEACGKCESCREIEEGRSLDIIEIDAASNRGIDDVRSLKESAYLLPLRAKKKVFIIDEVHMLTKEAFNALLKLIEEPPKATLFILCTTDAQKIPETVLSRLLRVNFRKGEEKELLRSLDKSIKGEGVEIDKEAKRLIIEKSDGSFRNLQKSLNEIYLQYGKKIGQKEVESYFSQSFGDYGGEEVEKDLEGGKLKEILEKLENLAKKGVDFSQLRLRWLEYFHQKMLADLGDARTKEILEKLILAGEWERIALIEQLPLQMAIIELGERKNSEVRKENLEKKKEEKKEKEKAEVGEGNLEKIEELWGEVLKAVKPYNHSVEAFLRAARPKKMEGDRLVIEVFYKFHKDKLEEAKNRQIVDKGLRQIYGEGINFVCVLGERRKQNSEARGQNLEEKEEEADYDKAEEIFS